MDLRGSRHRDRWILKVQASESVDFDAPGIRLGGFGDSRHRNRWILRIVGISRSRSSLSRNPRHFCVQDMWALEEEGLYPIKPKRGAWFLDKGRKHPVLKISRQQLPLAPAFAMTAHAAQGQTLPASRHQHRWIWRLQASESMELKAPSMKIEGF